MRRAVAWAAFAAVLIGIQSAWAAIAFVQVNAATSDFDQTSITINYASAQNAGDLNVVIVGWEDTTSSVSSVTDSKGNTYTLAGGPAQSAGNASIAIYYAKNIAAATAGSNTVTVTFNAAVPFPDIRIAEYSGIDTVSPFDVAHGASGVGSEADSGPATTTNANDLIVAGNMLEYWNQSAGAGFNLRIYSDHSHILEDRVVTNTGSYSATTPVITGWWVMQMAAFKGATTGDTQAPTAPTNLSATAASSSQINLSWTASTDNVGVTGYRVERCQGAGCSNFAQVGTPSGTTFSDTGLSASTSYTYRVRAQDAVPNLSGYSNSASATTQAATDTQAPTVPTNLSATAASSTQINLSWTASTDNVAVTGYRVERCQGAGCSTFAQVGTPTGTTFNDSGLSASTSYTYRVRAQDAVPNLSGYSSTASATTQAGADTQAPTAPTNLSATPASSTQINLSWTASTDNVAVTGYRVERCQGAGCSTFTQVGTPSGTTFNDTGLTASTSYSYRVRAQDAVPNLSGYSSTASATTQSAGDTQAPTAPGSLTAAAASSTQVDLTWAASTDNVGVTGYVVERCQVSSCSFSAIRTLAGTKYSDLSVSGSTAYSYRVRAQDAAKNFSAYSNTANATSGAGATAVTTSYTYDLAGRLRTVSNAGTSTSYTLDAAGNRKQVTTATGAGTLQFQQAAYSTPETGSVTVSVTRSLATGGAVSVHYTTANGATPNANAVAPSDYTTTSGTLSWPDGDATPRTITIPIAQDSILEGNEVFTVALDSPSGGAVLGLQSQTTVTILDDDGVGLAIANISVNEAAGSANITVTKSGASAVTNLVSYASANGTAVAGADYTAVSGTLTFGPSDTTKTITVPVTNDNIYKGNRTFTVTLSNATNGATIVPGSGTSTVTLLEDDVQPVFGIDSVVAAEGSTLWFTVARSGALGAINSVNFSTANVTAAAGTNYSGNSGTLTFNPGVSSLQIPVTSINDGLYNNSLLFNLNLSSPTNLALIGTGTGTGTIQNVNAAPVFTLTGGEGAVEGGTVNYTITMTGATALTHTINYTTADITTTQGVDYSPRSGTLSFSGSGSQTVGVPTLQEFVGPNAEPAIESFSFAISSPSNGATISGNASVTSIIVDADSPPPVPTNVRKTPFGTISPQAPFIVAWDGTLGDNRYIVKQATGITSQNYSVIFDGSTNGFVGPLTRNANTYRYNVQACRDNYCSAESIPVTVIVCNPTNC